MRGVALLLALFFSSGCQGQSGEQTVEIQSTESTCQVVPGAIKAGHVLITATHQGVLTADVRLSGSDGAVLAEVGDVDERVTQVFTGNLRAGTYTVTCVPDSGDAGGIQGPLKVE